MKIILSGFDYEGTRYFIKRLGAMAAYSNRSFEAQYVGNIIRKDRLTVHVLIENLKNKFIYDSVEFCHGEADVIISGNTEEAYKNLDFLRFKGKMIILDSWELKDVKGEIFTELKRILGDDCIYFNKEEEIPVRAISFEKIIDEISKIMT